MRNFASEEKVQDENQTPNLIIPQFKAPVIQKTFSEQSLGLACQGIQSQGSNTHRRNNPLQSAFLNTINSTSSALQSARDINSVVNFENTQELKAFATIDMVKINRDRSDQLKQALEENLKEKEQEKEEIQKSYNQQKEEYDKITAQYKELNNKMQSEFQRQKDSITRMKKEIKQKDSEHSKVEEEYLRASQELVDQKNSESGRFSLLDQDMKKLEQQLHMLQMQKKGYQLSIEMSKKVKTQELDLKLVPLENEKKNIQDNIQALQEQIYVLYDYFRQSENEHHMLIEDLQTSEMMKADLAFEREELDGMVENIKNSNEEVKYVHDLLNNNLQEQTFLSWDQIKQRLITQKERELLLNLIRELQQYLLGFSSNTTDNSIMQSEDLEDVQNLIENDRIPTDQAITLIVEYSANKLKLDLNEEQLQDKLCQLSEHINFQQIRSQINEIKEIEESAVSLDIRIKAIQNRCQNELKPRLKAQEKSEESMRIEILKAEQQYRELEDYFEQVENEIDNVKESFTSTYQANSQDFNEMEENMTEINTQIQDIEYKIDSFKQEHSELKDLLENIESKIQTLDIENQEFNKQIKQEIRELKEQLKQELKMQNEVDSNPQLEGIQDQLTRLKYDQESSYKRLKYIETKLNNALESVNHAKIVIDNHVLQHQQDQLNNRKLAVKPLTTIPNMGLKRQSTSALLGKIEQKTTRITLVETKANSLSRGKMLSPDSKDFEGEQIIGGNHLKKDSQLSNNVPQTITKQLTYSQLDSERMHNHFIEKQQPYQQSNNDQLQQFSQHSHTNSNIEQSNFQQNPNQNKSTFDMVRYYDSSNQSISEDPSQIVLTRNPQRQVPCQQLITPRDQIMDNYGTYNSTMKPNGDFIYENLNSQYSEQSFTSYQTSCLQSEKINYRKNSFNGMESVESFFEKAEHSANQNAFNQRQYMHQGCIDLQPRIGGHHISMKSNQPVMAMYSQFKENLIPNQNQRVINLKRLSQATDLSKINNSNSQSRQPAVPSSKLSDKRTTPKRGSSSKRQSIYKQQFTSGNQKPPTQNKVPPLQEDQIVKQITQKLRLNLNIKNNNGRAIQTGIVDFVKCHSGQRDQAFFENIRPLIEGSQFLMLMGNQLVFKQMFVDFSLLRIHIDNFNGEKEQIMIEHIVKPELPQSTLEMIRQEKNGFQGQGSKRYEFNLMLNFGQGVEKLSLIALSYEELKKWVVGINSLISNKNNLIRLASLINY